MVRRSSGGMRSVQGPMGVAVGVMVAVGEGVFVGMVVAVGKGVGELGGLVTDNGELLVEMTGTAVAVALTVGATVASAACCLIMAFGAGVETAVC